MCIDIAWISSYERCCYNSLWSEAWEHSFMHKASFSDTMVGDIIVLHCLLILFSFLHLGSVKPAEVKIIDFGSACMEDRTVYSYIQVTVASFCSNLLDCADISIFTKFFLCRVGTIDHLKFFWDISILKFLVRSYFLSSPFLIKVPAGGWTGAATEFDCMCNWVEKFL